MCAGGGLANPKNERTWRHGRLSVASWGPTFRRRIPPSIFSNVNRIESEARHSQMAFVPWTRFTPSDGCDGFSW